MAQADSNSPLTTNERQVLPFRRPGSLPGRHMPTQPPKLPDLGQYQRSPEEPGDYRHRMLMNVLALTFVIGLVAAGIWIAGVMSQMRKNQDCVLTGRTGCTPVEVPIRPR